MTRPALILVSGPPASGKTSLARRIAGDFELPFLHKDGIKETLFDAIGWSDKAWSRKLGIGSVAVLFYAVERLLTAGCSVVAESNFDPMFDRPTLAGLRERVQPRVIEIHCMADVATILARSKKRIESGERHAGHRGSTPDEDVDAALAGVVAAGTHSPLVPESEVLRLDTSDFATIDYDAVYRVVREAIGKEEGSQIGR